MSDKGKMTLKEAARIQSATAKANKGKVPKGSFAARAMSAAAKNESSETKDSSSGSDKKSEKK